MNKRIKKKFDRRHFQALLSECLIDHDVDSLNRVIKGPGKTSKKMHWMINYLKTPVNK